jgi:phospholipid/cholesterol/gamma-HCH transport system substrate-binding protein
MHEMRRNVVVGLFVLFGLLALATLVVLFGRAPTLFAGGGRFTLNVQFTNVSGIKAGTPVTVGGIAVGRVERVGFRDPDRFDLGANVVISLDAQYARIPQGTRAVTTEPGFGMGRPPIELVPPAEPGPMLADGAALTGEMVPAMDALFPASVRGNFERAAVQIGDAAGALRPVLDDLHDILRPRTVAEVDRPGGLPGNLATAATRLDGLLKHANEVLGDPNVQSQLRVTIDNLAAMTDSGKAAVTDLRQAASDFRELAGKGKDFVGRATESLARLDQQIDRVGNDASTALQSADRTLVELHGILKRAATGQGTVGRLLSDERLYEAAALSFERIAEMVREFNLLVKEWQKGRIRVSL